MPESMIPLLEEIAANTSRNDSLWVASIAGTFAILGALTASLISYFAAKASLASQAKLERQRLIATVVSAERLIWLKEIRGKTAEFYTKMDVQINHLQRPVASSEPEALQQLIDAYAEQAVSLSHAIFPMLNTTKEHQRALSFAINDTMAFMNAVTRRKTFDALQIDKRPYAKLKTDAFKSLENIGIKAWDKVQSLE